MSTGPTTMPDNGPQDHGAPRRWYPRLRDTRIRSKLALILVVPVAAVLALASIRLVAIGQGAYDANLVRSLTALSTDVSALTQDIHKERMAAAALLKSPSQDKADAYNLTVRRTDERVAAYNDERRRIGAVPSAVEDRLRVIDDHLATLNGTRQEVLDHKQMPVAEAVLRYGVSMTDLVAYGDMLGQMSGEGRVGDSLRAVAAFSRAKAATAEQEAVTFAALSDGQLDEEQFSSFVATLTSQQEALLAFSLVATPDQRALVDGTVTGDAVVLADRVSAEVIRSVGQTSPVAAEDAGRAVAAVTDLMRWAEIQLEDRLLAQADRVSSDVVRQAIIESILVLITLVLAIALAVALARSLNRSLRRLREGALAVANHDLPDAVSRLRDMRSVDEGGVEEIVRQVRDPIRLSNRDEVGQVALAFNVVHREAVRIAAEQAALRTSVSSMFLNLARRSQALVDRMIGELDMIERGEEDPKRLAQLFELDHLATRMRRNDENLLVLAGADSTAPRRDAALLVDALRAAQSEVELYNRVEFGTVDTDVSVAAHAVNDVVRLVAELLDNATRFSPPKTSVVADARRIRDYVLIQVEDRGLGMTDEQLDSLNRRLTASSTVDVAAFRLMGLAVVSRLASRYGIRVELRRNVDGGTVAQVTLPAGIVVLPTVRENEPIINRPRQPLAVESAPAAAAPAATWSDPRAPVLAARTSAATLPDPSRVAAPARWDARSEPLVGGFPVNVPVRAAADQVQAPPAVPPLGDTNVGSHTAAYPTLGRAEQAAATPATMHPMSPVMPPTAGLPSGPVAGAPSPAPATAPGPADAAEMPIFREMEAVWFRSHGQDSTQIFTMPPAGYPPSSASTGSASRGRVQARAPLPTRTPGDSASPATYPTPPAAAPAPPPVATPGPAVRRPPGAAESSAWRTAADEGWARANRAAEPVVGGTTQSGLPKRVPQAQLVPGGVETKGDRERTRRTPDEVRGLLSAYHRGVQRGRSAGSELNGTISTKETSG